MAGPATVAEFLALVRQSGLIEGERLDAALEQFRAGAGLPAEPKDLARLLVDHGALTFFQAEQLLQGKWRGFTIGKFQLLERLGAGGMGIVYLCEHKVLRRRVAVKFLPTHLAQDPSFLEFFYKEAEATAALDHPNIVHAHDVDHEGNLHFLVMEYVDGASLQEYVDKHGPLEPVAAAHYLRQAACGLQHAHERGLVHRDVKPANLLLDCHGTIKVLDMGLAHFFRAGQSEAPAPRRNGMKMIVGTDDYLAPEQIVNSDAVDIRADVYSLGATGYFLLTGRPLFDDTDQAYQKFLRHLARSPRPLRELRPEVPAELAAVIEKMMAKNPWDRYQTPAAVVAALAPLTQTPPPPPPPLDRPHLSPAARLSAVVAADRAATRKPSSWVISTVRRPPE